MDGYCGRDTTTTAATTTTTVPLSLYSFAIRKDDELSRVTHRVRLCTASFLAHSAAEPPYQQ